MINLELNVYLLGKEVIKLKRDFSNASKQKLLGMVDDVEKEKFCDFTDFVGDSYYKFQAWIGKLNIKNYLKDVDSYHKKVIDKNNTSKKEIEKIFANVENVDVTYQAKFSAIKSNIERYDRYIIQMGGVINPGNSDFNSKYVENACKTVDGGIIFINNLNPLPQRQPVLSTGKIVGGWVKFIEEFGNTRTTTALPQDNWKSLFKDALKIDEKISKKVSSILGFIGKKGKNNELSLSSSIISYFSSLCGVATKDTTEATDAVSNILSLFKSSAKMELGLYKYYEKRLPTFDFMRLNKRFGKTMAGLSIGTSAISWTDGAIDTYKIFKNDDSSRADKIAQVVDLVGDTVEFGGNSYIAAMGSQKYLRYVDKISGSKKNAVNQILVDTRELKYTTSSSVSKKIDNVSTGIAVTKVITSTASSGIRRGGELLEDGTLDLGDWGSIGVYASLSGLNEVTSNLTGGIIHFDSDRIASEIETKASDYVTSDKKVSKFIQEQLEEGHWYNKAAAMGASMGASVDIIKDKLLEDGSIGIENVKKTAKATASWISTGWNYVNTNFLGH